MLSAIYSVVSHIRRRRRHASAISFLPGILHRVVPCIMTGVLPRFVHSTLPGFIPSNVYRASCPVWYLTCGSSVVFAVRVQHGLGRWGAAYVVVYSVCEVLGRRLFTAA